MKNREGLKANPKVFFRSSFCMRWRKRKELSVKTQMLKKGVTNGQNSNHAE